MAMTNPLSFEAFMEAYQDMVYTIAVRLLGGEAEAEDIAQEVFLKAYEHYNGLSQSPRAGGWLRTVTRNLCLNYLARYRSRWRFFSEMTSEDEDEDYTARLPVAEPAAGVEFDRWRFLEEAIQKLPASQRVPLVLYHFEEMQYEEIAGRLGVSLSKIKTDIHRGREALYRRLRNREDWPDGR
ncbi:MAG: RNA polymerase sigma factor [Candidatus Omnitrophica bacterium]|nr:RNA polymerase sigma factor [Candidatus Omnitrophota bacterium]